MVDSTDLKQLHAKLFKDLDLMVMVQEYKDLMMQEDSELFPSLPLSDRFNRLLTTDMFPNLKVAFARVIAAKPYSADVERLISSSVALKSSGRSWMLLGTENNFPYVHYNMPTLDQWDPQSGMLEQRSS